MTDKQPTALRLADALHDWGVTYASNFGMQRMLTGAAAELRRLHELNEGLRDQNTKLDKKLAELERVNAQLLEALEEAADATEYHPDHPLMKRCFAAIAAAKGKA